MGPGQPPSRARWPSNYGATSPESQLNVQSNNYILATHYSCWEYQCLSHCVISGISVRMQLPSTCFSLGLCVSFCTCEAKDSGRPHVGFGVSSLCIILLSSTLPCWLQPFGGPTFFFFSPALAWVLTPCAVVWKAPKQKARVNVDFTSFVFLFTRFPSL